MDLHEIEYAASIVFTIVREHPEICPDDYSWTASCKQKENDEWKHYYTCRLCGKQKIVTTDSEKIPLAPR